MARGYPDFFGFSIFPYYGRVLLATDTVVVPGADYVELLSLACKGVAIVLEIEGRRTAAGATPAFRLYVDGELIYAITIGDFFIYGSVRGCKDLFQLDYYGVDNNKEIVHLTHDLPFGSSLIVQGADPAAAGCTFVVTAYYYIID